MVTRVVKNILQHYSGESPGVKANIARMLMHGKLGGTGKMLILPVDQGFEHGPVRSFIRNPQAFDPEYHFELAIKAGLSAYAAPLGMLAIGANKYAGQIPLILKMNSANSISCSSLEPDQAITGSIKDALTLGCSAVGFTIYPGSNNFLHMVEEVQDLAREAKSYGLAVVIWSYPRGKAIQKEDETSLDVISYAAHIAAVLGADIIKVKPPKSSVSLSHTKHLYEDNKIDITSLSSRIKHIMQCVFAGKRLVVFSGGDAKDDNDLYSEVKEIHAGGGSGSIIGRNSFQRPLEDALKLLNNIINIYKS